MHTEQILKIIMITLSVQYESSYLMLTIVRRPYPMLAKYSSGGV